MSKEDTYRRTLVDAIHTIDDVQYMKFHPKWARLRKIIDLVLNKDWDYDDDTIEYAEECVRISENYYNKKREEKSSRVRVNAKKELDIISTVDDVDDIDRRTPWKKMDTWMKKTKLRTFAKTLACQSGRDQNEVEELVLALYQKGKLKKPGVVEYCQDRGEIVNLHHNEITEMNLQKS